MRLRPSTVHHQHLWVIFRDLSLVRHPVCLVPGSCLLLNKPVSIPIAGFFCLSAIQHLALRPNVSFWFEASVHSFFSPKNEKDLDRVDSVSLAKLHGDFRKRCVKCHRVAPGFFVVVVKWELSENIWPTATLRLRSLVIILYPGTSYGLCWTSKTLFVGSKTLFWWYRVPIAGFFRPPLLLSGQTEFIVLHASASFCFEACSVLLLT